ncbi:MAG: AMP-binding protein [Flavobacteriales bacterium]|nr:AMP-binding protein [Flavobacteriales bacterium]MCX7768071.1 AMP-binding protein [Flavobacteriales bacterium]MDW8410920.1 AMP-binding protein [Flavobacteriales bacterium]
MSSLKTPNPWQGFTVIALEPPAQEAAEALDHFVQEVRKGNSALEFRTSGSTGPPKKIIVDSKKILLSAEASINAVGLEAHPGALISPLPAHTVAARMMAVRAWMLGRPLGVLKPALRPALEKIPSEPIAQIALSPSQCKALLDSGLGHVLASMGCVLVGGGPVSPNLETLLQQSQISVFITYGMTETLGHVALRRPGQPYYRSLNPSIRFSREEHGRLIIVAPWIDGPLLTTDIGEVLDPFTMRWIGRADFVINSGGVKIHPEEVERLLSPFMPPDLAWFVGPAPDEQFGCVPVLYVEGEVPSINWSELWVNAIPEKLWRPRRVVALPCFHRSSEGKFLRGPTLRTILEQH